MQPSSFQIESHYELSELKTGVTDEYQLKSGCFQHSFDLKPEYDGWRPRSPNVFSVSNENLCRRNHEVRLRVIPLKVFLIYREKINFFLTSQRVLMFLFNNRQTKQEATCALNLSDFLLIHFRSSSNTEIDHLQVSNLSSYKKYFAWTRAQLSSNVERFYEVERKMPTRVHR